MLYVASGTGSTAITAGGITGAKVLCVDFTQYLLTKAKVELSLAETADIERKEGNVEDLPFEN